MPSAGFRPVRAEVIQPVNSKMPFTHTSASRKRYWPIRAATLTPLPGSGLLANHERSAAFSNHRVISADAQTVAFRWEDYRINRGDRRKVLRLATPKFIRRFLMHALPLSADCFAIAFRTMDGFHRIRRYGLLAGGTRNTNLT